MYDHPVLDANVNTPPTLLNHADFSGSLTMTSTGRLSPTPNPHDPKHPWDILCRSLVKLRLPRRRVHVRFARGHKRDP